MIVSDVDEPRVAETVAALDTAGRVHGVAADLVSNDGRDRLVDRARAVTGRLDVLVNNAATLVGSAPLLETDDEMWATSAAVNLLAPAGLIRRVLPLMIEGGGGSIVTIGSTASLGAEPGFGAYTAMKHGLVGLAKTVAVEFGPLGVRSNLVCPGFIDTDMHRAANERLAREAGRDVEEIRADRYAAVPARRAGTPAEVAEMVMFLAGPGAAYVNGAVIPVGGGVPYGI